MTQKPTREMIWEYVKAIRTCMMVTHDDGEVRARPMRGIPRPEQNAIWFFADSGSNSTEEVQANPVACLTFVDLKDNVYVSLSGRISRVLDQEIINEVWDEEVSTYFSQGQADPRLILLHFSPETGEYWSAPSSPIVVAIKFLEARIMGERPSLGENGQARLG